MERNYLVKLCETHARKKGVIVTRNDSEYLMVTGFNWHSVPMFFYLEEDDGPMPVQHDIIKKMGPAIIERMKLLDTDKDRAELHWISATRISGDSFFLRDVILTVHVDEKKGELR